ncbi:MAG: hypothetical protein IKQ80_06645 [Clostridia bacterium]|nr:hypothetical protein [Clostridia bacterium]
MMKRSRFPRLLAVLAALSALALTASAALAESAVQAVVSVESMNVYAPEAPHALMGTLPKGTQVTVTARSGDAVMIRCGDRTGVARASDLARATETPAQAETGKAMVANRDSRVYSKASTSSRYTGISAGDSVELLAVNGDVARVKRDGKVGYMAYSHLSEPGAQTQTAQATVEMTAVNVPAVTNQSAKVYASAAMTGKSVRVDKGFSVTLVAVQGDIAKVQRGSAVGYIRLSALSKAGEKSAAAAKSDANPFAQGSNERTIYAYLTGEIGYNRAAAMGVMANIKYESSYNPNCNGDGGTSYGICQWHAGRKNNLICYCDEYGLDYTTLEGQLQFLKYELASRYPAVHSYLKNVENTADGAYDAGYYFCFNFEAPAARTSQSTKRATYAMETLFGMK